LSPDLSLVVPVYNRPEEVAELLASLAQQSEGGFEVLVVEDGSEHHCRQEVEAWQQALDLKYFFKANNGPGLSRNYGAERAQGDYLIFLDSDCVAPPGYVAAVRRSLRQTQADAFGGPDRAQASFTPVQKAINYSMTSFFTTGGIRGSRKSLEQFHPRSFNMGMSRGAFRRTGGFSALRFGEDIDLSIRIIEAGFKTALFPDAFVYHKRRTRFRQFFKQIFNSGIARINLYRRHPQSLKAVHFFPALFTLGLLGAVLLAAFAGWPYGLALYLAYALLIFGDALIQSGQLGVALLSVWASFQQLLAYGGGFILAFYRRILRGKGEFARFTRNFYR